MGLITGGGIAEPAKTAIHKNIPPNRMAVVLTNQDVCFCRHLDDQNGKHICALDRKHNPDHRT